MEESSSEHPQQVLQTTCSDQGSRPFTSLLLSAPPVSQAQQQASSSSDAKSPSLLQHGRSSLFPPADGYIWKACAQNMVPGCVNPTMYYKCAQESCDASKLVVCSADGHQVLETVLSGCHSHPRPSEMGAGDVLALPGFETGSQEDCELPDVSISEAETSMPGSGDGDDEQRSGSSDEGDDDDVGQARGEEDVVGGDIAKERHMPNPAERITAQTGTGNSHRHAGGKRRSKSKVWEEFTAVLRGDKIQKVECKHCKMCLGGTSTGRTAHLRQHLKICPARTATGRVQQQRSSSPHPSSTFEMIQNFDQERSLEFLIKALVSNLFSSPLTNSSTFRQLWAGICPTNNVVSQAAIEQKFLSIFEKEKLKLKEEIALTPGGVFLIVTMDYFETKHFISLVVHFIDKEWNLNRKILKCCFAGCDFDTEYYVSMFPYYQSCHNFFTGNMKAAKEKIVKEVVQTWSLEWKLLGVSSPKSLDAAIVSDLEKNLTDQNYLLAKCKLLNLPCIIDALNDLFGYEMNEYVLTISRLWFEYMTCSELRRDKYKEIVSRLQISRPSFGSQRWYLTFYSLEVALKFNNELPNPQQLDFKYYPSKPSFTQLKAAEDFCDLVRSIYHAIKVISRSRNATLNSKFHAIWNLKIALLRSSEKENIDLVFDVDDMQRKFDQLWRKWYLWLSLAVVLDPRYKIRFLVVSFNQAFGSHTAKRYILEVRGKLYELFLQYSWHVDQQNSENFDQRTTDLQFDTHGSIPAHGTNQNYIEQAAHEELGEVIRYLEGELIPPNLNFDILKWWKENASTYPTLARLARDILAIPASAVSTESAFDETDERVSLFNRKLSPETVEALICTQDWIKYSEISDEVGGNTNMPA